MGVSTETDGRSSTYLHGNLHLHTLKLISASMKADLLLLAFIYFHRGV